MKRYHSHKGMALVTVLFITGIGLLFGAGALLLFRNQCQWRIERQHEMEKVYAVRSAINSLGTSDGQVDYDYCTGSDRYLKLIVKPVDRIFPDFSNTGHLDIGDEGKNNRVLAIPCTHSRCRCFTNYCEQLDYEYGAIGITNSLQDIIKNATVKTVKQGPRVRTITTYGLKFDDISATNNVEWWVNIGMRNTQGWLRDPYGRRYYFWPKEYVNGENAGSVKDIIRLCIVRNVTNTTAEIGQNHGWPLSQKAYNNDGKYLGERALVFSISPKKEYVTGEDDGNGNSKKTSVATFSEYWYTGEFAKEIPRLIVDPWPDNGYMGIQIACDKVTLFYVGMAGTGVDANGYTFSDSVTMTADTYEYFKDKVVIGGEPYPGTNVVNGQVEAPELRAVFDVVAKSDVRSGSDFLVNFRVTPAYQYDVFVARPDLTYKRQNSSVLCYDLVTNRATVVQLSGEYDRDREGYTTRLTYDTHGTENRGFRKDEREAERRRNGQ